MYDHFMLGWRRKQLHTFFEISFNSFEKYGHEAGLMKEMSRLLIVSPYNKTLCVTHYS
jgi:hypothetical protein